MRGADSLRPQSIDDGRKLDEIPTEAFKADTETSVNILNGHFWEIWERKKNPEDWKEGIHIKLLKRDCNNYRGELLSCQGLARSS